MNKLIYMLFACLFLLNACDKSNAQDKAVETKSSVQVARYQIIQASANNAWKIDTQDGTVWFCSAANGQVVCMQAKN